jgi:hypothetical protein
MLPVGVTGAPASVSVTVAVQVVEAKTRMLEGEQESDVPAARGATARDMRALLAKWTRSPEAYVAVSWCRPPPTAVGV